MNFAPMFIEMIQNKLSNKLHNKISNNLNKTHVHSSRNVNCPFNPNLLKNTRCLNETPLNAANTVPYSLTHLP